MTHSYDVVIIGAGSVGIPTAMALTTSGMKTLVLDSKASPGQGENKKAIGGIRATHSDPAKIMIGKRSLEIFSTWEKLFGDKIEWMKGGYLFPVYRNTEEIFLKKLLPLQKKLGLNIDFIDHSTLANMIPGINNKKLIGGTFSPNDGSASPLLAINAFAKQALSGGTDFKFREKVEKIVTYKNKVCGVRTNKQLYSTRIVVDSAGAKSAKICQTAGANIQVFPDSHEAAITEPVERLFKCMIVDLRPGPGSKNFYLYQNIHGQIVFCITPDPPIFGTDTGETSYFLPQVTKRILNLIPILKSIRVRRMWRGCYPMTPDGSLIVGWNKEVTGLFHATGMCGQGFMLGPGVGELTKRIITQTCSRNDQVPKEAFSPHRRFSDNQEVLK